jgi:flavodoxin
MSRKLVAYFSASGNTAKAAKDPGGGFGRGSHEIKPAVLSYESGP